jgi:hypothetical protein|tara:strand:+ start:115 stop:552 length:438 start_codon:yes stop_codon:yes gene_type:complete
MKAIKRIAKKIFIVIFPIFLGNSIYILYRDPTFNIINWLDLNENLKNFNIGVNLVDLPNWVIYNLPDGLWVFSFTYTILFIMKFRFKKKYIFLTLLIPLNISFISEIGQLFGYFQGTFDIYDILFYLIGYSFPIILNFKKIKIIK